MKKIVACIKLMRLHHSVKNALVLLPAFFGGIIFTRSGFAGAVGAFFAFSLAASSIYVLNDICDAQRDRLHPEKCKRPIASGELGVSAAWILFGGLLALGAAVSLLLGSLSGAVILLLYVVLNALYSFGGKSIPIADLCILVSGFCLRVVYGSCITGTPMSKWLNLMVIAISFFMALGKRRGELLGTAETTRNVLRFYTHGFLDKNMYVFLAMTDIFYALWASDEKLATVCAKNPRFLIWTVPLVILITLRYSYKIESGGDGDPVEVLLSDRVLQGIVLLYALAMLFIFYF